MNAWTTVACAALAAAAAKASPAEARSDAAEQKAVAKVATDWAEAWNRHDAEGLSTLFAERGDLINPMGKVAKGRQQVRDLFQAEHTGRLKASTMALTCEPARFFDANVAQVDCDFALDGIADPQGMAPLRGHMTDVMTRDGERWTIASARAMVPMPAGKPSAAPAVVRQQRGTR